MSLCNVQQSVRVVGGLKADIVSLSAVRKSCTDGTCPLCQTMPEHKSGIESCSTAVQYHVLRSNYGLWSDEVEHKRLSPAERPLLVIGFVESHYYPFLATPDSTHVSILLGTEAVSSGCSGEDGANSFDVDDMDDDDEHSGMATALKDAVSNLELAKAIATVDRQDDAKLPSSMLRLPSGHIAFVDTVVQKVFAAAEELRGSGLRGEAFKTRLSAIAATAKSAENIRTIATGYSMEEGTMLEVLGDVAVQVYDDSAGETWYLGKVMAMQDKPGKRWQNRSHPVSLDSMATVRVKCEWYHRAKGDASGERCTFYLGDHPTDKDLSAPLDVAWYEGTSILGLVTTEYDRSMGAFIVDTELCKHFDEQTAVSAPRSKRKSRKRKTNSDQSVAVSGARRPGRDNEGRSARAAKRAYATPPNDMSVQMPASGQVAAPAASQESKRRDEAGETK